MMLIIGLDPEKHCKAANLKDSFNNTMAAVKLTMQKLIATY